MKLLFKRLLLVYLVYFLCRVVFYLANESYFPVISIPRFFLDCLYALRFDTFSIIIANSLFILLSLIPGKFFWNERYQKLLMWVFMVPNTVFIAFNCVDIGYFPFIKKRSTSELFDQMGGQSDLSLLLPRFFIDFWWVLVAFILLICLLSFFYYNTKVKGGLTKTSKAFQSKALQWATFLSLIGLSVLGVRGGFQRVPIDLVNAGAVTSPAEVPIVLNTPFSLIKSLSMTSLPALEYYDEKELRTIYNPIHHFKDSTFKKENVVILILESFSKEYTKLGLNPGLTPFLDSLMDHGLLFTNGFSNGTKSIEGIPAILSSLPSLMVNPFINSMYANNEQTSFATLLNEEGYDCAFFHGGINGTMNFTDWASLAGYKKYYGRDEYGNDADFDKFWGILDEPFLQFTVKKMTDMKQPFHSAIFTLSSHHPYLVPEKYKGLLRKTSLENSESISYADLSLSRFFESAQKMDWYKNTLFVLVADHCGISEHPFYSNVFGNLTIPILFYKGDNSLKGSYPQVFTQVDILPSVMQYLGYNKPFFSFGNSYLENIPAREGFYFSGHSYYQFNDSMVFSYSFPELREVFKYRQDSTLSKNKMQFDPITDSLARRRFKGFMQTYNSTLINNAGRLK